MRRKCSPARTVAASRQTRLRREEQRQTRPKCFPAPGQMRPKCSPARRREHGQRRRPSKPRSGEASMQGCRRSASGRTWSPSGPDTKAIGGDALDVPATAASAATPPARRSVVGRRGRAPLPERRRARTPSPRPKGLIRRSRGRDQARPPPGHAASVTACGASGRAPAASSAAESRSVGSTPGEPGASRRPVIPSDRPRSPRRQTFRSRCDTPHRPSPTSETAGRLD